MAGELGRQIAHLYHATVVTSDFGVEVGSKSDLNIFLIELGSSWSTMKVRDVWQVAGSLEVVRAFLLQVSLESSVDLFDGLWGDQCGNLAKRTPCIEACNTSECWKEDVGRGLLVASWR